MKPVNWVLRVVVVGFFMSLLSTVALNTRSESSSQPFIPPQRLGLLASLSKRFLWGFGTKKDAFELNNRNPVVWEDFSKEVSVKELHRVDEDFVEPLVNGILVHVLRKGHQDVGVTETSSQHTRRLRELAEEYQEALRFNDRELLELRLMLGIHETPEAMVFDASRFAPLPMNPLERSRKIKGFKPISVRKERARLRREWKLERPFVFAVTSGYDERRRRIILYFYDRFYLGMDRGATFARQIHYFQPARDIGGLTDDSLVINWFLKVAFAFLRNERLRGDLAATYGVEEPVGSDNN